MVPPNGSIATGTNVYFTIRTSEQAHVYLYQETPAGGINVMFPHPQMPMVNPLPAGQDLRIPPKPGFFTLEAEGVGREQVHIVASIEPLAKLETSLGNIKRIGSLRVNTNNLRAGYLRKNGVPFSEQAFMTEYYNLIVEEDGAQYLVVQLYVADPRYLTGHWVRTVQFKREADASKRNPTACSAS